MPPGRLPLSPSIEVSELAERAEEVRAWLVQLRGGAPFLSSADGALLAGWLEAGLPVPAILRGIEATAERRRAKRVRAPFSLKSCKAEVERAARHAPRAPRPPAPDLGGVLLPDVVGLDEAERALAAETRAALAALAESDPEARARAACALVRAFHEALWALHAPRHDALRAEAAEELADLKDAVGEAGFDALCEEWARERVRGRVPSLTATRVWEECGLGLA